MTGVLDRLLPTSALELPGGHASIQSNSQQNVSIALVLLCLGVMYSVHNLIAPNMTAIAAMFHFDSFERDAYIGGELTLFFYFPGVFGALLTGILSSLFERRLLIVALAFVTAFSCLLTARVATFRELAWDRAITGFAIGGSLPVVYSLVGDWFPARRRATATALVSAASGAGVFLGQCVATVVGTSDWRWPFEVIALPAAVSGLLIWFLAKEPLRGGQEDCVRNIALCQSNGVASPGLSLRHLRALCNNRTTMLVILQAFPGNIPWGVIIVYMHDYLVQDLGFSVQNALGAIGILAAAAFAGIFTGGFVSDYLYVRAHGGYLALFGGICNIFRAVPFCLLFGWKRFFGSLDASHQGPLFFTLLIAGGFSATMGSPCTGSMLLNVNVPEMRGSVMALYSVLDDLSKGFGTLFVSIIVRMVGGRAGAYQLSMMIWVITGTILLKAWHTCPEDEQKMKRSMEEAAMESMVLLSKSRAQHAVKDSARAAGEAHFLQHQKSNRASLLSPTCNYQSTSVSADSGPPRRCVPERDRDRLKTASRRAAQAADTAVATSFRH